MVIAVLLGVISGALAFVPLFLGLRASRKVTQTSNFGHAAILLLAVLASFLILAITAALCINFARDVVLPFVVAEALALSVSAIAFGLYRQVKK